MKNVEYWSFIDKKRRINGGNRMVYCITKLWNEITSMTGPETQICPIHHGELTSPVMLPCHHSFCLSCISSFLDDKTNCPVCDLSIPNNYQVKLKEFLTQLSHPKVISGSDIHYQQLVSSTPSRELVSGTFRQYSITWFKYTQLENNTDVQKEAYQQYHVIKSLNFSDKLIRIFGVTEKPTGIVCEDLSVTIQDLLDKRRRLSLDEISTIAQDILTGLSELHGKSFVSDEFCAKSVLLQVKHHRISRVKLFPFRNGPYSATNETVKTLESVAYNPPEVLLGLTEKRTPAGDVFSFGVLLWCLISNNDPSLVRESLEAIQSDRMKAKGAALIDLTGIPMKFKGFIQVSTSVNPDDRPTAALLLNILRSCFSDYDGDDVVVEIGTEPVVSSPVVSTPVVSAPVREENTTGSREQDPGQQCLQMMLFMFVFFLIFFTFYTASQRDQ
ncbi:hypothetical protein GEMRC1_006248 [Eukaryota sp. GEM-RC1]